MPIRVITRPEFSAYVEVPIVPTHGRLEGRDEPDQHPIGSVTGLQEALDSKQVRIVAGSVLSLLPSGLLEHRVVNDQTGRYGSEGGWPTMVLDGHGHVAEAAEIGVERVTEAQIKDIISKLEEE